MNTPDLLKIATSLGSPTILLVGDFMLDIYVYGDALRISPEAPVQVLKVIKREYYGGGAASVAADVLTLGAGCICIGITGDDKNGHELRKQLSEQGADISGLLTVKDRPTISKERVIGLAQHRHRQQLLRIDDEITTPLEASHYDTLLNLFEQKLANADIVCLQDYNKGVLEPAFCQRLIHLAQKAGKKVLVDPPLHEDYSKFRGATLITPNRKETTIASGITVDTLEAAQKAAVKLFDQLQLDAAVITLDKEGAFLHTSMISEQIPTQPRTVYDVTGAGDMMLAMIAVAVAAGCDYKTAVQLSNIAAGLEVEKFGVATVTIDEIVNEIVAERKGKTGKIRDTAALTVELICHRRAGRKIVFTNGCFDVLHIGHIEYLKFCKSHGDIVVVGLNSDNSIRQIKGPTRPINNQHERAAVLAALEYVDYVVIFDRPDPLELVEQVKPDILIKGVDWAEKGVIGREFVESYGGKVILAPMVDGKSTTATLEKNETAINHVHSEKKAVFLDRDNTLIEDPGYISHPGQVKLLPGTAASISQLRKMDFLVIVVSNQSGVARGIVTEEVLAQIHHQLEKLLADEGAFLDGIYFCPFHPDGVIAKYRMESELRKPAAGMLLKAAEDFNVDLSCCWMIGDSYRDIEAGQRAGCKTILINNPVKPVTKNPSDPVPDRQAVNIREAVNIIRMYELRQSMETTQDHKLNDPAVTQAPQEIAVSAASDSAAPVVTTAPRTETYKAPSIQKSNEQAIEDIANKMKPYEQVLITPSANNGLKATPALTPEILADPLHKETDWPGQQQPSISVKSITPAEPVKPKTFPAPSAEDSRTEKLLQELLGHLRSVHRSRQYEDFTISKVAAAAAQVLAIACLVVSLWPFIDSTRNSDWTGIMLGYAAVLQLMAMAFYMMRER